MYRAFVSSTYDDLLDHRAEVIRTVQAAGIQVDPMENWQADRAAPGEFSAKRIENCDLCILVVAFRRGTVPPGQGRSIVQIEYDEARRRGIDVLPFLLRDDVHAGPGGWPPEFDDRTRDPAVAEWRAELRRSHGLGDFGTDPKSLRVEAALARWVVQRVADRDKAVRRARLALAGAVLAGIVISTAWIAYLYLDAGQRSAMLGRFLAFHDPAAFNSSKDGRYQIARLLADRPALTGNTNLLLDFRGTKESLDILVNNAQYIRTSQTETFRELIRRGVRVRLILLDYTTKSGSYEAFHRATGISVAESMEGSRIIRAFLIQLRKEMVDDPGRYRGSLEFRWNPKPLLYTMWIRDWRDGGNPNVLGHLAMHFYRGEAHWPAIRVSSVDGPGMLDNMHEEFETAWAASTAEVENPEAAR